MNHTEVLLLSFLIGVVAGLRSLTAPAVASWAAHLGRLSLTGTALAFLGSIVTVIIFTLLALVEIVNDKRPSTPNRTGVVGLSVRIVTGGLTGAALAAAGAQSKLLGAILGAAGGVSGAFGGLNIRKWLVHALKLPDMVVAVSEDIVTVALGILIVTRF
jgi:uncharacterized membrane protein